MRNQTNCITILFVAALITAYSCTKEPDGSPAKIQNPTSYILKRQTWSGVPSNGLSVAYFYNSDHLISRIEKYVWGIGFADTSYSTFEYENGRCRKRTEYDGYARAYPYGYFIYEYNKDDLPVKRTYHSDSAVEFYTFYKYDNANNLIEKFDSSHSVDFRHVFSYNGDNNLVKVIDYILWSSPQQKSQREWSSFDNKVNFIKAVNGLPSPDDNNVGEFSSSSPNNYVIEAAYDQIDIDQPFGQPRFYNYTYEYNEEGLPVKITEIPWIVTFEYEKYK